MTTMILAGLLGLGIGLLVGMLRNIALGHHTPPTPMARLEREARAQAIQTTAVSQAQYQVLAKAIADIVNGEIGGCIGPRRQEGPRY